MMLDWPEYVADRYNYVESGTMRREFDRLVRPVVRGPIRRVLDVGTGAGQQLAGMAELFPQAELHGVDISARNLAFAQGELNRRGVAAVLGRVDGAHLAYPSGAFDLVSSHLTMPYVRKEGAFLAECARVLRSGGGLWLSTHGVGLYVRYLVQRSPYHKLRYLACMVAGATSMAFGWKPVSDTPVTVRWLRARVNRVGIDVSSLEWGYYGPLPQILTLCGVRR